MLYDDPLYGPQTIEEPILLDLLDSAAMQRLQGVLQHGITAHVGITRPVTRYEHSVGVMLLIRRLGGSLAEQIAGLLHDVSHTAFSHVIDYVVQGHDRQSFHDEHKEAYMARSDLPAVLAQHGYDWRDFLHEEAFPLLEQPAPRLCADRLDYFLRDARDLGLAGPAGVRKVLTHLVVHEGRIVTDDLLTAQWLGYTYMAADEASWANFREVGLYELTAQAIRRALALGVITETAFWEVDSALWAQLQAAADPTLQGLLALVRPDTRFLWDEENPDFWVSTKLRTIDPEVLQNGRIVPLSSLDEHFAHARQQYLTQKQGPWPMRVLSFG